MTEMKDWSVAFCFEVLGSAEEISVKSLGGGIHTIIVVFQAGVSGCE